MEHKDCGDEQPAKRQRVGEDCADAMVTEESAHICAKRAAPATSQPACLTSRDKILAVERDYTHFYLLDVMDEPGADQFVYKHFNSLCVVGVAPSHVAFANGRKVVKVDFDVGRSGDKTQANKPSGKKKSGALYVKEDSRMCDLVCDDGSRFKVRSGIDGHLLEMNKRLGESSDPINNKPRQEGYIAIIQPKRDEGTQSNPHLLTVDEYRAKRPGVLI